MKNIYITIIVLVLVVFGFWFFVMNNKKMETPEAINNNVDNTENNSANDDQNTLVKEFTISGQDFSFVPSLITVKKGDKVKITFNNTAGFHDFKIDEYGVATKKTEAPSQEVLEFTADKSGEFEYYCSVGTHRAMGMKGTLKVE